MADATYQPKVYRKQGGAEFVVASGGKINVETGGTIEVGGVDLIDEIKALSGLESGEVAFIDGVTAGTVAASKACVVSADKDLGDFRNLDAVNIDAGKDATAGTVDIFPATTARGKMTIQCTDNGDTSTLTVTNAAITGGNKTVTIPALTGYAAISTAACSLAEVDVLDGAGTGGTPVASKVQVADANQNIGAIKGTSLAIGVSGAEVLLASTPAQIDAAVAGTPLIYRTQHLAAAVEAGSGVCVPAVAGKQFKVLDIMMRAYGGNAANATTVEVFEETANTVFLSHVIADLLNGVWNTQINGTAVITGMTAGGLTSAANKALKISATGGAGLDTCTGIDVIVTGYYTTA